MKLNRLSFLFVVLTSVATAHADLAALFTNTAPARTVLLRRPSIIFIQCHDLALGDLSCYGQTNFQTPNLDRLAQAGIRFTHYTGGADSAATIEQLLAGKISAPAPDEPNLAQRLQASGYRTGLIGEWSLGSQPWLHGFDDFAGFLDEAAAQDYFPGELWRCLPNSVLDRTNNRLTTYIGKEMLYPNTGGHKDQYLPDLFAKAMVNFVKNNEPDRFNHFRPYFLLVNFPAPRTATTGADNFPVPSDAPFTGEPWPQAAKNRAALITRLDSGIGRLLEQLNKSKLSNSVAIFFASSCAPEKFANTNLNFLLPQDNFRDAKKPAPQTLPLIVNWPGRAPAGRVSNLTVSALDIAPTALAMAYAKPVPGLTGISILPTLLGKSGTNAPSLPDRPSLPPDSRQF
jgi:uncharacterized sulfatase